MAERPRCAICGGKVAPRAENEFFPFCSERCRLIDLGKWLGGDYAIPGRPASDSELADEFRKKGSDGEDGGETVH